MRDSDCEIEILIYERELPLLQESLKEVNARLSADETVVYIDSKEKVSETEYMNVKMKIASSDGLADMWIWYELGYEMGLLYKRYKTARKKS